MQSFFRKFYKLFLRINALRNLISFTKAFFYLKILKLELTTINLKANILQTSNAEVSGQTIFKNYKNRTSISESINSDEFHKVDKFISTTIKCTFSIDIKKFTELLANPTNGVERAKGFLRDKNGTYFLIQFDGKNFDIDKFDEKRESAIVVIGRDGFFDEKEFIIKFNNISA